MADVKITALTALTGANSATTDVYPIVDVSVPETKKQTRAELFKSIPGGSWIAGFLGINNASPACALDITQTVTGGNGPFVTLRGPGDTPTAFGPGFVFRNGVSAKKAFIICQEQSSGSDLLFSNPDSPFTNHMRLTEAAGYLLVGYSSSNGSYRLQVNSQIFATSATVATSDGRYKENVQPLTGAMALVARLNPVQFTWKEHPVHEFDRAAPTIGFIAQEVQDALAGEPYLPSIVKENVCTYVTPEGEQKTEDFLGIAEGNMIPLLTKALQEAMTEIASLRARVEALEAQ